MRVAEGFGRVNATQLMAWKCCVYCANKQTRYSNSAKGRNRIDFTVSVGEWYFQCTLLVQSTTQKAIIDEEKVIILITWITYHHYSKLFLRPFHHTTAEQWAQFIFCWLMNDSRMSLWSIFLVWSVLVRAARQSLEGISPHSLCTVLWGNDSETFKELQIC